MIKAVLFDLDGTLVETERLKAISYARAAHELCPDDVKEAEVIRDYKHWVGLSRQQVAEGIIKHFDLEQPASQRMAELGVNTTWEALSKIRVDIYEKMLEDPTLLQRSAYPHNIALLHQARQQGYRTALTTMSHRNQVVTVLDALHISDLFDFVAVRDDVKEGKPDPEIYLLVLKNLNLPAKQCLAIEDSLPGVQSALNAAVDVISVTTEFTRETVHAAHILPAEQVVDDPATLPEVFADVIARHQADA